jgi:hypothetical protein
MEPTNIKIMVTVLLVPINRNNSVPVLCVVCCDLLRGLRHVLHKATQIRALTLPPASFSFFARILICFLYFLHCSDRASNFSCRSCGKTNWASAQLLQCSRDYTTLHYTTLHYTTLHYTTSHHTTPHHTPHHTTSHHTTYTTPHHTTHHTTPHTTPHTHHTSHHTTYTTHHTPHHTTPHYTTLHNCTTFIAQHIDKPASIHKPFTAITVTTVEPVNILQLSHMWTVQWSKSSKWLQNSFMF